MPKEAESPPPQKNGVINPHNNNSNQFHMDNFDALKMLRINHEMTVYLHILLLRTPGPVPFGICICSNVETILS